jgi:hypothetical protein
MSMDVRSPSLNLNVAAISDPKSSSINRNVMHSVAVTNSSTLIAPSALHNSPEAAISRISSIESLKEDKQKLDEKFSYIMKRVNSFKVREDAQDMK